MPDPTAIDPLGAHTSSRAAAELEGSMDKHPAIPGALIPARELLGDLLLERNDAAAALQEYQAVLRTAPNRFRSLLGTARAATLVRDESTVRKAYRQLVADCVKTRTL